MSPTRPPFWFRAAAGAVAAMAVLCAGPEPRAGAEEATRKVLHETHCLAQTRFLAGGPAAFRVVVRGATGYADSFPIEGAEVGVDWILASEPSRGLWQGRTDAAGHADVRFVVPESPGAEATIRIRTRSAYGADEIARRVSVSGGARLLLTTDKPLYQPAQAIHVRVLALHPGTGAAMARALVRFEIEDPRGNRILRRDETATEFGVARLDFTLADEVTLGDYRIRATVGESTAERTVALRRYVLPRFKTTMALDKTAYRPGETLRGEIQADTVYDKPVARGAATLTAKTPSGRAVAEVRLTLDDQGHGRFDLTVPPSQSESLSLQLAVRDQAEHEERVTQSVPIAADVLHLALVPESGWLVPDFENRVYLVAARPDGTPVACRATIRETGGSDGAGIEHIVRTGEHGIGTFTLTPPRASLQPAYRSSGLDPFQGIRGAPGAFETAGLFVLSVTAQDEQGLTAERVFQVPSEAPGANLLLRLDRSIFVVGDVMRIEAFANCAGRGTLYLDFARSGQTVFTTTTPMVDGRAQIDLPLGDDLAGSVEVHGYYVTKAAEIVSDARLAIVTPASGLRVDIACDRETYRPGQEATLRFSVRNSDGNPAVAALGVTGIDASVLALEDCAPGQERVFLTLARELTRPALPIRHAGASLAEIVRAPHVDARRQEIAGVLLALAEPLPRVDWVENPRALRLYDLRDRLDRLASALAAGISVGTVRVVVDPRTARPRFAADTLPRLAGDSRLGLSSGDLVDPWGRAITIELLASLDSRFDFEHWESVYPVAGVARLFDLLVDVGRVETIVEPDPRGGYRHRSGVLETLAQRARARGDSAPFEDERGAPWSFAVLALEYPAFSAENLALAIRGARLAEALRRVKEAVDRDGLARLTWFDRRARTVRWTLRPLDEVFPDWPREWGSVFPEELRHPTLEGLARFDPAFRLEAMIEASLYTRAAAVLARRRPSAAVTPGAGGPLGRNSLLAVEETDPWGEPMAVKIAADVPTHAATAASPRWSVVSAGPDRRFGSPDDIVVPDPGPAAAETPLGRPRPTPPALEELRTALRRLEKPERRGWNLRFRTAYSFLNASKGFSQDFPNGPADLWVRDYEIEIAQQAAIAEPVRPGRRLDPSPAMPAEPPRIREYFPETLLWEPLLVTDEHGKAELRLPVADSITTWRLAALASTATGCVGSAEQSMRVFQDFFVDLELPSALTQGDEVTVPVSVHNYLSEPQTVRLVLEQGEPAGFAVLSATETVLRLGAGELAPASFRVRAIRDGFQRLTVVAQGTRLSDAVRRGVEVQPNGRRVDWTEVHCSSSVRTTVEVPGDALGDAARISIKVYPSMLAQVVEGVEGMLRMPHG